MARQRVFGLGVVGAGTAEIDVRHRAEDAAEQPALHEDERQDARDRAARVARRHVLAIVVERTLVDVLPIVQVIERASIRRDECIPFGARVVARDLHGERSFSHAPTSSVYNASWARAMCWFVK